jgi:hypothetical protein
MNATNFNMLLWLGFAVFALLGKFIFEHVATRAEERRALETAQAAAHSEKPGAKLAPRS